MRRWIAVLWHASFFVLAGALYFFFVLPRWFELTGAWPNGLGEAMRIVCGALIGLAALPVVFTLLRTRRPEFGTPKLALSLRLSSIVLHVLAGALIVGAAVSEIWVSLDVAGQTLFGIYGAAAAVAVLGALAFYLAFAAELPPPPPKPLKVKTQTRGRGRNREDDAAEEASDDVADEAMVDNATADSDGPDVDPPDAVVEHVSDDTPAPVSVEKSVKASESAEVAEPAETTDAPEVTEPAEVTKTAAIDEPSSNGTGNAGNADERDDDESGGTLRNRRPAGKSTSRLLGRARRGTALDD